MLRIVFDTNVLIDGFHDDFSAQARLIDAVRDGEIEALVTPAIMQEYRRILRRLIEDSQYADRIEDFLSMAREVSAQNVHVEIDDEEDEKFFEAAVGGGADLVVTNDRHLLDVGEIEHIRVVTPQEAWAITEEETGGSNEWQAFVEGLGIGKK
jgi:uncharacterized protein